MATTRDQQRLMKMDEEILELRYLYEREKQREVMLDKHTLLVSRAFKSKLERAMRARNLLSNSMKNSMSAKMTFEIELGIRKEAVNEALEELKHVEQSIVDLGVQVMLDPQNENLQYELREAHAERPVQKRRVAAKERAVTNWLDKGMNLAKKENRTRLTKIEYNVKDDISAIADTLPDSTILNTIKNVLNPLENTPNWKKPEFIDPMSLLLQEEQRVPVQQTFSLADGEFDSSIFTTKHDKITIEDED